MSVENRHAGSGFRGPKYDLVILDEPFVADLSQKPSDVTMKVTFIDGDGNPIPQVRDYPAGGGRPSPGWLSKAQREREAREWVEANDLAMSEGFLTQTSVQLDELFKETTRRAIAKANAPQVYVPGIGQFSTYRPLDGWAMAWPDLRSTDVELPFEAP